MAKPFRRLQKYAKGLGERESKAKARAELAAQKERERKAKREAEKLKREQARERRMSFNSATSFTIKNSLYTGKVIVSNTGRARACVSASLSGLPLC